MKIEEFNLNKEDRTFENLQKNYDEIRNSNIEFVNIVNEFFEKLRATNVPSMNVYSLLDTIENSKKTNEEKEVDALAKKWREEFKYVLDVKMRFLNSVEDMVDRNNRFYK